MRRQLWTGNGSESSGENKAGGVRNRARRAVSWSVVIGGLLVAALAAGPPGGAVRADFPYEQEPINYSKAPVNDPVAKLQAALDAGTARLEYEPHFGYLRSLLQELDTPVSSQSLVYSKTSFQRSRIAPRTPRAVYFGDDAYVGFVQHGDVLEITSVDPQQGAIFYSLSQEKVDKPQFVRHTDNCLVCHASSKTSDVPGHVVRSVFSDRAGQPIYSSGTYNTNHDSPFGQRWGGWYVTGRHGKSVHMGNQLFSEKEATDRADLSTGANVVDLSDRFDTSKYLSPHSDIVALMVMEHQTHMHNLLTRSNFDARSALWYNQALNKAFGEPEGHRSESTQRRLKNAAESLLRYLLFVDEPRLTDAIEGTSPFAQEFAAQGPRDARGRSLRDLDLQTRLFKHPCSYLIYSPSFRSLPAEVREHFFHRLYEILTGRDTKPEFQKIAAADRQAILEILRDTLPDLPAEWREPVEAVAPVR